MIQLNKLFLLVLLLCNVETGMSQIRENIAYVPSSDTSAYRKERCKLDIYCPPKSAKPFKTLIWFHGGGLEGGEKSIPTQLIGKGFAVVAPNYRLFPKVKNPGYTRDAAAAVAWVFRHIAEYGGDPSEIYVGGHSAGGYLALMLCLDKSWLGEFGVDADSVKAYFPVGGQTATHYTIRKERGISFTSPIVDKYAPLNCVRKLGTRLYLMTGDRKMEQMARYEENLYLKAVLEGIGNTEIPLYELQGFDHNTACVPAWEIIPRLMKHK